jgi:hypothetical protein
MEKISVMPAKPVKAPAGSNIAQVIEALGGAIKSYNKIKKQHGSKIKPWLQAGGIGLAAGTGLGALHAYTHKDEELGKIKKLLAAQEMQQPGGNPQKIEQALAKVSSQHPMYKFAKFTPPNVVESALMAGGLVVPPALLYNYYKDQKAKKVLAGEEEKQKQLSGKYDQLFRDQILEELHADPKVYAENVQNLKKVSSSQLPPRLKYTLGGLLATGMATHGFITGRDAGAASNPELQKIKGYRKQLEQTMRLRDKPAFFNTEMSPEELVALEASRDTAGKKPAKGAGAIKADAVKNTKGGTGAKLSAKPDDPELQKLLQSV